MLALVIFTNDRAITFLLWEIFFFFFLDINSIKNKTFFKEGQKKKDVESIYNVV